MAMLFLTIIALRLVLLYQDAAGNLVLHCSTALGHNQAGALAQQLAKPEDFAAVDEFALRIGHYVGALLYFGYMYLARCCTHFNFLVWNSFNFKTKQVLKLSCIFSINLHFHFSIMNAKVCDILHICVDHRCNWVACLDMF